MNTRFPLWVVWPVMFVLVNVSLRLPGNVNPASRLAALSAMTERHSFQIDAYVAGPMAWTSDWAQTPDGHYYSNKAPGPMLIGYPLFLLIDKIVTRGLSDASDRDHQRRQCLPIYNFWLCLILQILPFAWVGGVALHHAVSYEFPPAFLHFSALALFFGNTASLLMNTYFGHGMAAMFVLAGVLAFLTDHPSRTGLFLGCAALCDYGTLLFIPLMGLFYMWQHRHRRRFLGGLIAPVIAWCFYHTVCFGSPWTLALQFQNPEYVDPSPNYLWHGLLALPQPIIAWKLLAGFSRGLLFCAPWILVALAVITTKRVLLFRTDPRQRHLYIFVLGGFLGLWTLNASFNGWHGGMAIGPRYMSPVFPVLAFLMPWLLGVVSHRVQQALWGSLGVALALGGLVFATTLYGHPKDALWPFLYDRLIHTFPQSLERLLIYVGALLVPFALARQKENLDVDEKMHTV